MEEYTKVAQTFIVDHQITLAIVLGIGLCVLGLRKYVKGTRYYGSVRIDGKTVIITGANTGIGKETAIDLAKRGAKVVIGCRDMSKGKNAEEEIKKGSGSQNIHLKCLDLASLKSVRRFADDINKTEKRLDILINNAGVMYCPYWKTEDGFEMQFGTNHLGHFLLTNMLLDLIKKSAPSRIINVSSMGHTFVGRIDFNDINKEKHYNPVVSYSESKLANVLFTKELANRIQGTGVTTYSLHPGVINTELARHARNWWAFIIEPIYFISRFFMKTPEEGAQTSIYCAVDESLATKTGRYYSDCAEKAPSKAALDIGAAKKLWEVSEKMVGLVAGK